MSQIDEPIGQVANQWMRLDLHIHTPASDDYAEPEASYLDILREAERHELDMIAITDHNTVHGYEQFRLEVDFLKRLAASERCTDEERERLKEYERILAKLTVLPGFEFTSHFGAHILAVFDPETSISLLEATLLQLGVPPQQIKQGSCAIPDTRYVTEAYEIIARNGGIVIAAHANGPAGVITEITNNQSSGQSRIAATQHQALHALEFVHFHTSHERFFSPSFYQGQHDQYERPMFCIQGSDAHRVRRLADPQLDPKRAHGIGDRYFEALLPERSFAALKELFAGRDVSRVRVPRRDQKQWEIDQLTTSGDSTHQLLRTPSEETITSLWTDIAALANADGGVMVISLRELPPTITHATLNELLRTQVAAQLPAPPKLAFELITYQEEEMVRIEVTTTEPPPYVSVAGAVFVRRDDQTVPANRDEILQLSRRALAAGALSPLDNGEELDLPRSGVEIVGQQKRNGVWGYEVRDLRTTTGVERERAQGLWAYAISRHEDLRDEKVDLYAQVRWLGRLGLWRVFQQGNRTKYDLVHRDANGVIDHIFYGVSDWGLSEGWQSLLNTYIETNELELGATPSYHTESEGLAADEQPPLKPLAWGDRKYRWRNRGGLWRIYGTEDQLRFDLALKDHQTAEEFKEYANVSRAKITDSWLAMIRVERPNTGIEVIEVHDDEEGRSFRFLNLRTGEASDPWRESDLETGTVREYAARMYLQDLPIQDENVRWWGNLGYMRPMRSQVDLVYRDEEGHDHIYYAARRDELEGIWRELLEQWPDD